MFDPDTNLTGLRIFRPVYDMGITTLAALGTIASAGAATYTAASAGKTPKLEPKLDMPDPNDPVALEAKRRKQEDITASKGRESTILDDNTPAYSQSELGL